MQILNTGVGDLSDPYVECSPETVVWGRLPNRASAPVAHVRPGQHVVIDTLSHEGILEDQGRDPAGFFQAQGVPIDGVLQDAISIAAEVSHDPAADGPHVVPGPVFVEGAHPGDVLAFHIESLLPRVPYGVVSNRHGKGALPQQLPAGGTTVSVFASVVHRNGAMYGMMPKSGVDANAIAGIGDETARAAALRTLWGDSVHFPLHPFLGIMGVASDTDEKLNSVPPGPFGGNIDINMLVAGTTLYVPVQVEGALAYVGDPHFAQGDGEVSLTAMEASLRARLRFEVIPAAEVRARFGEIDGPMVETDEFLVPTGRDRDLNVAVEHCVRQALSLLHSRWGMDTAHAYAYLSAATDFNISEVVDIVKGVHARVRKADFEEDAQ